MGFYLTVKEWHNTYKDVLEDLYNRELKEPLLIVADGIKNLDEEVMEIYPGSEFQLCTIHYARGLKSNVREKDIDEITIDAKIYIILSYVIFYWHFNAYYAKPLL